MRRPTSIRRARGVVNYAIKACGKCGEPLRQVAQHCPTCGAKPDRNEVDYGLLDRQRRLREFREAAGNPSGIQAHALPSDVRDFREEAEKRASRLHAALGKFIDGRLSPTDFAHIYADFDAFRSALEVPLPRPARNSGRIVSLAVSEFQRAISTGVEAYASLDMGGAQEAARASQSHIDQAVRLISRLAMDNQSLSEAIRDASDELPHGADASLVDVIQGLGAQADLRSHGGNSGLEVFAARLVARQFFDSMKFEELLEAAEELVDRTDIVDLFATDGWVEQHQQAQDRAIGDLKQLIRLLEDEDATDQEHLDGFMAFVDDLREVRLRYSLAVMLAANGFPVAPGGRGQQCGKLIKQASSHWPQLGLEKILNENLRQVAAHRDYALRSGRVILRPENPLEESMSVDAFVDKVLAQWELVTAFETAIAIAQSKHGVPVALSSHAATTTRTALLEILLAVAGLSATETIWDDTTLRLQADGELKNVGQCIAAINTLIPAEVIDVHLDTSSDTITAHLPPLRDYQGTSHDAGAERVLAFMRVCAHIRVNGKATCPIRSWDDLAAYVAVSVLDAGPSEVVRQLKRARTTCVEADEAQAVKNCDLMLKHVRGGGLDDSPLPGPLRGTADAFIIKRAGRDSGWCD